MSLLTVLLSLLILSAHARVPKELQDPEVTPKQQLKSLQENQRLQKQRAEEQLEQGRVLQEQEDILKQQQEQELLNKKVL